MPVRVLIVDDSLFFRKRLTDIISADPELEVIGTANNGEQAIEFAKKLQPDVITMDLEMPIMDGITATRHIMSSQHPAAILMLSTWTTEHAKATADALDAGAVGFMPKQFEEISSDNTEAQHKLCQHIYQLATKSKVEKIQPIVPNFLAKTTTQETPPNVAIDIQLVTIGTSTGGPVALHNILNNLPASFPHPIVIVQHMPETFTPSFADRLNEQCEIHIKQAEEGEKLKAGTAYLAPGGKQMLLKGHRSKIYVTLEQSQSNQNYSPCIDTTFNSIAKICGNKTLAIILTGMGSDGQEGCQTLHQSGATIWSQDKQSSTIYGMPMAIAKAGLPDRILSLSDITQHLVEMS